MSMDFGTTLNLINSPHQPGLCRNIWLTVSGERVNPKLATKRATNSEAMQN